MKHFSSPFVWLRRFRHRCGYGVHSPFAFRLLIEVVYERAPYYAYDELDALLPYPMRFRQRKGLHLLLRLANRHQPSTTYLAEDAWWPKRYIKAGCKKTTFHCQLTEGMKVDLCYLSRPDDSLLGHIHEGTMLLLDDLHQHREWFRSLPSVVSFDLYDIGIAFFDPKYNRQHYIINF